MARHLRAPRARPHRADARRLCRLAGAVIDPDNRAAALHRRDARREFDRPDAAATLYRQAWDAVQDEHEACIAAHYLARRPDDARRHLPLEPGSPAPPKP